MATACMWFWSTCEVLVQRITARVSVLQFVYCIYQLPNIGYWSKACPLHAHWNIGLLWAVSCGHVRLVMFCWLCCVRAIARLPELALSQYLLIFTQISTSLYFYSVTTIAVGLGRDVLFCLLDVGRLTLEWWFEVLIVTSANCIGPWCACVGMQLTWCARVLDSLLSVWVIKQLSNHSCGPVSPICVVSAAPLVNLIWTLRLFEMCSLSS